MNETAKGLLSRWDDEFIRIYKCMDKWYNRTDYEQEYIPFLLARMGVSELTRDVLTDLITANKRDQRFILKHDYDFILGAVSDSLDLYTMQYVKELKRTGTYNRFTEMQIFKQARAALECSPDKDRKSACHKRWLALKSLELVLLKERQKFADEEELRKKKIREEQQALKELKKEKERAEKDEQKARESIEKNRIAMQKAKNDEQLKRLQNQIADLEQALQRAIERKERAISMAQQTRCGYVYIISNIGSFGEGVYKIGMTRRVDPMERVRELGDASVPFPFDVHAMIYTDDAPGLEAHLHRVFDLQKVNAVNFRKEYFRVPLADIRCEVEKSGIHCEWMETPEASQYRDSEWVRKVGNMDVSELEQYMQEHTDEFRPPREYNPFDTWDE